MQRYLLIIATLMAYCLNLQAGKDCLFSEIQISASAEDCESGSYYFNLDFTIDCGSQEGFEVWVNGASEGTYNYGAVPYTIGPFLGDGTTGLTVLLQDLDSEACSIEGFVDPLLCPTCLLSDLTVEALPCDEEQQFMIALDFEGTTVSDSFYVQVNADSFGPYAYSQVPPYQIGPFLGDGETAWEIAVLDQGDSNCSSMGILNPIDCPVPCNLSVIEWEMNCRLDGTFEIIMDFAEKEEGQSYFLQIGGETMGPFTAEDFPYSQEFTQEVSGELLFLSVSTNETCLLSAFAALPECPVCQMNILEVEVEECADDLFGVYLSVEVLDPASNSFHLLGNGTDYGYFSYDQSPYYIGPLNADGTTDYEFIVIDSIDLACTIDTSIGTMFCPSPCSVGSLTADYQCTETGAIDLEINFAYEGAVSSGFTFEINGNTQGFYNYTDLPISTTLFLSAESVNLFQVTDGVDSNCLATYTLTAPDCPICEFQNIEVVSTTCDTNTGTFLLEVDFTSGSNGTDFTIQENGNSIASFSYSNSTYLLGPLVGDGMLHTLSFIDNESSSCVGTLELMFPACIEKCSITNLEYTLSCVDGNTTMEIDFESAAASEEFTIDISGQNFGFFDYSDLPMVLDLTAFPVGANTMTISDSSDPLCFLEETFIPIDCESCLINNLEIENLNCTEEGAFFLDLYFDQQGSSGQVEITANGDNQGVFNSSPAQLGPFLGDGITNYTFTVNDKLDSDCFDIIAMEPVLCTIPCMFSEFETSLTCESNGELHLLLDFNYEGEIADSFELIIEGSIIETFSYSELPITGYDLDWLINGNTALISVRNQGDSSCFLSVQEEVPICPTCEIGNVEIELTNCDVSQSFYAEITFDFNNIGGGGFDLFVNDTLFGNFLYGQSSYSVGPFLGDEITSYEIKIVDSEWIDCFAVMEIEPISCPPICELSNLIIEETCTENGNSNLFIDFEYFGTNMNDFELFINGSSYGYYLYADTPIQLMGLWFNEGDHITAHLVDGSIAGCSYTKTETANDCSIPECSITDLQVKLGACEGEMFYLEMSFENIFSGSLGFSVWINGVLNSSFSYGQTAYLLGPFLGDGTNNIFLEVIDNENLDCSSSIQIEPASCEPEATCLLSNLELFTDCNDDGTWNLQLDIDVENSSSLGFDLFINEINQGFYAYANLPVTLSGLNFTTGSIFQIRLLDEGNLEACEINAELASPDCPIPICNIDNVIIEVLPCNTEGFYYFDLEFDHINAGTSFSVDINGDNFGIYPYSNNSTEIGPVLGVDGGVLSVSISDIETMACSANVELPATVCPTVSNCVFTELEVQLNCESDSVMAISGSFIVEEPASNYYNIYIDGAFIQNAPYTENNFVFSNLEETAGTFLEILIQDADLTDCFIQAVVEVPMCEPATCVLNELTIESHSCDTDGMFLMDIAFTSENVVDSFAINLNGELYSTFAYGQIFYTIGPFDSQESEDWAVVINDLLDPDCFVASVLESPNCVEEQACSFSENDFSLSCNEENEIEINLNVEVQNNTSPYFDLYFDGAFYGFYLYTELPLLISDSSAFLDNQLQVTIQGTGEDVCFIEQTIELPDCPQESCQFTNLSFTQGECSESGLFYGLLEFEVTGDFSESFLITGNGNNYGQNNYGNVPYLVGPFLGDGSSYELVVTDSVDDSCQSSFEFQAMLCESTICSISNLDFAFECDEEDLLLNIDFELGEGNSNAFQLEVEDFIETYLYQDLPVQINILPPLEEDTFLISVSDALAEDCNNSVAIMVPECETITPCQITEISAVSTLCVEGEFLVEFNFTAEGQTDQEFGLSGNGNNYGIYTATDMPIVLGPFTGDGSTVLEFELMATSNEECSDFVVLTSPFCSLPCALADLEVLMDCQDDGSLEIILDFVVTGEASDSFQLSFNELLFGNFAYSEIPLTIENTQAIPNLEYLVSISDQENSVCMLQTEIVAPVCDQPCTFENLEATTNDCTDEGVYVYLSFDIQGGSDLGFEIIGNGNEYGNFLYGEDSYELGPFWIEGSEELEFILIDKGEEECNTFTVVSMLDCPMPVCLLSDLSVLSNCSSPENYELEIDFNFSNITSSLFDLVINDELVGSFEFEDLPIELSEFQSESEEILVLINESGNLDCFTESTFPLANCPQEDCISGNLEFELHECEEGQFYIDFWLSDFEHTSSAFGVTGNGIEYGFYNYAQGFYTIGPLLGDGTIVYELAIVDSLFEDCQTGIEIGIVDCSDVQDCLLQNLVVTPTCLENGSWNWEVDFENEHTISASFSLLINNEFIGTYPYADLPLQLENYEDEEALFEIQVFDNDAPDCSIVLEAENPNCALMNPCVIEGIIEPTFTCTGQEEIQLTFGIQAENNSSKFDLFINEIYQGTFEYETESYEITLPSSEEVLIYEIFIVDDLSENCTYSELLEGIICPLAPKCSLENLSIGQTCDTATGLYIFGIDVEGVEQTNTYLLTINEAEVELLGSDFPYTSEAIETESEDIVVVVTDLLIENCSIELEAELEDCEIEICSLEIAIAESSICEDGLFTVDFEVNNSFASDGFIVLWNGEFYESFSYGELNYTIGPFSPNSNEEGIDEISIVDDLNSTCFANFWVEEPSCEQLCEVEILAVEQMCMGQDSVNISISFESNADTLVFFANGEWLGETANAEAFFDFEIVSSGGELVILELISKSDELCSGMYELEISDCTLPCPIESFAVDAECLENGSYALLLNLESNNTDGSLDLWLDDSFTATISYQDFPFTLEGVEITTAQNIQLALFDETLEDCSIFNELSLEPCFPECPIGPLNLSVDCTENGGLELLIDFDLLDPTATGGVNVFVDQEASGFFPYNLLPAFLWIETGNTTEEIVIEIQDSENPDCIQMESINFLECEPLDTICVLTDLFAIQGPCTIMQSELMIQFDAVGNGPDFDVFVDELFIGNYAYGQNSYSLGMFDLAESAVLMITVQDTDSDCTISIEMAINDCEPADCLYDNLIVDSECQADGLHGLYIDFDYEGSTSIGFDLFLEGNFYGFYFYQQLPLQLVDVNLPYEESVLLTINENDLENCLLEETIEVVDCYNLFCGFDSVESEMQGCNDQQEFELDVFVEHTGLDGFFVIEQGNNTFGPFEYGESHYTIGPFAAMEAGSFDLVLQDVYTADCFAELIVDYTECAQAVDSCGLELVNVEQSSCEEGVFTTNVELNAYEVDTVQLSIDELVYGLYDINEGSIEISDLLGDGTNYQALLTSLNCDDSLVVEIEGQECFEPLGSNTTPKAWLQEMMLNLSLGEWGESNSIEGIISNGGMNSEGTIIDAQELDDLIEIRIIDVDSRTLVSYEVPKENVSNGRLEIDMSFLPQTLYIVFIEINSTYHVGKVLHIKN